MKLQRLHIKNFKSIVDLKIVEPNPFTVFVGPNGSGKSNIFEALEFLNVWNRFNDSDFIVSMFGGTDSIVHYNYPNLESAIIIKTDPYEIRTHSFTHLSRKYQYGYAASEYIDWLKWKDESLEYKLFVENFSRIFVSKESTEKFRLGGDSKLSAATSNLEKVLKRILLDENKREEIKEWLDLFIPGFENIEIVSSDLSGTDTLVMYEKGMKKPFTKDLLSDGTYNILALLTAVYQSDEPQFLCIEEPENGLTPYVIEQFVELFRTACQEKGHYIWLNTHSPNLVRHLRADELIVVDKKQGATQIKQFKGNDYFGLRMDEAWLTNALGGGLPW
jgi:predicted ATPase